MVEIINKYTGYVMLVAEERKEEYLAAGHKLAAGSTEAKKPARRSVKKEV